MKYVYNQPQKAITPRFIITMILCDIAILLAVLIGSRLYHNHMVRHDAKTISGKKVRVTYYALEAHVGKDSVRVRVITRKVGTGGQHFFQSIMKY